jgi:hypothetical protein
MAGKQAATLLTGGNMHVADRRYKASSQRIMAGSQRRGRYMLLEQAGDETSISHQWAVEINPSPKRSYIRHITIIRPMRHS